MTYADGQTVGTYVHMSYADGLTVGIVDQCILFYCHPRSSTVPASYQIHI
jgi:hypothetical protein